MCAMSVMRYAPTSSAIFSFTPKTTRGGVGGGGGVRGSLSAADLQDQRGGEVREVVRSK